MSFTMDTKKQRDKLIQSCGKALIELDKIITQKIDIDGPEGLDPEKAKMAAQGKIEAIKGFRDTLAIIDELKKIDDESNAKEGEAKSSIFDGVSERAK